MNGFLFFGRCVSHRLTNSTKTWDILLDGWYSDGIAFNQWWISSSVCIEFLEIHLILCGGPSTEMDDLKSWRRATRVIDSARHSRPTKNLFNTCHTCFPPITPNQIGASYTRNNIFLCFKWKKSNKNGWNWNNAFTSESMASCNTNHLNQMNMPREWKIQFQHRIEI